MKIAEACNVWHNIARNRRLILPDCKQYIMIEGKQAMKSLSRKVLPEIKTTL
jgi:hypothetical protein